MYRIILSTSVSYLNMCAIEVSCEIQEQVDHVDLTWKSKKPVTNCKNLQAKRILF